MDTIITLWVFPQEDFEEWGVLVGEPDPRDYDEYMELIASVEEECRLQGGTPVRVYFGVEEMIEALAENDWDNTPGNRAAVVGLKHLGK